jgi:hypothetical protein
MDWLGIKDFFAQIGVGKDALHIYFAFLIQILAAAALRRPLSNWMPWAVVLLAAMSNEVMDIRYGQEPEVREWQVIGARHDILNTMVLPTLMLILCRLTPGLFRKRARRAAPAPVEDGAPDERTSHP